MTTDINRLHINFLHLINEIGKVGCEDFPDVFFPEGSEITKRYDTMTAKEICRSCPLIRECAQYAIRAEIEHGIFGGLTPEERRKLSRKRYTQR